MCSGCYDLLLAGQKPGSVLPEPSGQSLPFPSRRGGHLYLENVTLPGAEGKPVHMDHIVAGTFGVLVFNCYDYQGDLYGNPKDQQWHLYKKEEKKASFRNPLPQCKRQ